MLATLTQRRVLIMLAGLVLPCLVLPCLALAQDKPPGAIAVPIEQYGVANQHCQSWSDDCQTCARMADGKIACSTPGIACVRKAPSCMAVKWNPPKPAGEPKAQ